MAAYTIHQLERREELDRIVDFMSRDRYYPYTPYSIILNPVLGYTPEAQEQALAASKERAWNEFQAAKAQRKWICVKDHDGWVVGGCQYLTMKKSPFPNGCPELNLHWWPEGEQKDFAEAVLAQVMTPRCMWMQHEHGGKCSIGHLPRASG